MPELPDVEHFRRLLTASALRKRIAAVKVQDRRILGRLSPTVFARAVKDARFIATRRHGKHLLVRLDRGGWLTLHFGPNGSLAFVAKGGHAPTFTRVRFDFADGECLAYTNARMIGHVGLAEDAASFIASEELGPDLLSPRFDLARFSAAVAGHARDVKSTLMDQTAMAGIGNIYSDEILFQARLHPKLRADRLGRSQLSRLYRAARRVLKTAIARGAGSEQLTERLPASFLIPQRKKDGRCPRCGSPIRSAKFGGRTGYFCPRCQSLKKEVEA